MCVTIGPAIMSKTLIYSGKNPNNPLTNILAYQMNAKAVNDNFTDRFLLLPIPTNQAIQLHDSTLWNSVLDDMQTSITDSMVYDYQFGIQFMRGSLSKSMKTIKKIQCGIYDVGFIPSGDFDLLNQLPSVFPNCNIEVNHDFVSFYKKYYKNFTLMCVKFSNAVEMRSQPLVCEYYPTEFFKDKYYYPMLDNDSGEGVHDGLPKPFMVKRDHTIFFPVNNGLDVNHNCPLMAKRIGFYKYNDRMNNGDTFVLESGQPIENSNFEKYEGMF